MTSTRQIQLNFSFYILKSKMKNPHNVVLTLKHREKKKNIGKYLFALFNWLSLLMISVVLCLLTMFIWTKQFYWNKWSQKMKLKVMNICTDQTFNSYKNVHGRNSFSFTRSQFKRTGGKKKCSIWYHHNKLQIRNKFKRTYKDIIIFIMEYIKRTELIFSMNAIYFRVLGLL